MKDWGWGEEKPVNEKYQITEKAKRKRMFNIHFESCLLGSVVM